MDRKASSIIFLAFCLVASASAFDILKLLQKDSELSEFSKLLKETKLADQINQRKSITVLAVGNGGVSALSNVSPDEVKMLLSAHVVLDYFDEQKLKGTVKKEPTTVTTMLQATGKAQHQQGFIKVGLVKGEIAFGSAVKGAKMDSKLIKSVTSQPFDISVLKVSSLIEIPDLGSASAPKKAPSPSEDDDTAPAPSEDDDTAAPAPSEDDDTAAPAPSEDDETDFSSPPEPEDSSTEAPENAPEKSPQKAPEKEKPSATAPAPSAASHVEMALGAGLVMGLASLLA
ncbi:fasciclin-like arabinogalactan protein 3 [Rosa chinensis]|uniref:fasciclin-like arabinogalactan protein 3 n=1 Tax=Rosa chinensis TaxID=74649 RepID=UPI000D092B02|nr:fasciclin-like arabinogalactan protein 3 [Rosa chinensis]